MSTERSIRWDLIARLCPNATGAELRSVCTEAGMFAIRERRKIVSEKDCLAAVEKVCSFGLFLAGSFHPFSRLLPRGSAENPPERAPRPSKLTRSLQSHPTPGHPVWAEVQFHVRPAPPRPYLDQTSGS